MNALLDRLKTALDAQRKFIADAAHQLRTPLTAVKLHAEQAADRARSREALAAVKELRASADRAVRLSNQLLSLARAEPGEQAARFVDFDFAALAFDTGAEWVPRALRSHVDLGFQRLDDPENDHPLIARGNLVLLREVIANLIDNALKYIPPSRHDGARVTLTRDANSSMHRTGASAKSSSRTTARACRTTSSRISSSASSAATARRVEGGAGLGLAIVHDIMVLHGGSVHYEDAPEGGARFIVRIPLKPRARAGPRSPRHV